MTIEQQLVDWCREVLPNHVLVPAELQLEAVSGDAGFRSYYRLNTRPALIAVNAPPSHEDVPGFVDKALFFSDHGIHVPRVFAVEYSRGFMLLEDLGNTLLLSQLGRETVARHYCTAEALLLKIQGLSPGQCFNTYSQSKLQQEMQLFPQWFVGELLQINTEQEVQDMMETAFAGLTENALQQPQVIVHRDYHARNLMLQADGTLGVIDFQDAVFGPITYDLVSLLRDCYIRWPAELVIRRVCDYYRQAVELKLLEPVGEAQFLRWFNLMGLQRHIKVLGIFARLWLRDGKPGYLDDLPLVMRYVLEQTGEYPELIDFHRWLITDMLPVAQQQPWYSPWENAGENP